MRKLSTSLPTITHNSISLSLGIPKRSEDFLFFTIVDVMAFKSGLKDIVPDITSTQDIKDTREKISAHKAQGNTDLLKLVAINIAFTSPGLKKVITTSSVLNFCVKYLSLTFSSASQTTSEVYSMPDNSPVHKH